MAMMRYGRASKAILNGNGDGDKKLGPGDGTKGDGTPKKKYTEAELIANMDANTAYREAEEDYKRQMEIYNNQMNLYKQGSSQPKPDPNGVQLKGGKNVKGQDVNFTSEDSYSAEKANKYLNDAIKSGTVVDIYDKSINPNSRKVFLEQLGAGGGLKAHSDLYGSTTGKTYVDRDEVNKIKSNIDVWGEDFNAVEYEEASKKGKLDEYNKSKGYTNRTHIPKVGVYEQYNEPQMPIKPDIPPPPPPIKGSDVDFKPIELQKINKIANPKMKYLSDVEVTDEDGWKPPVASRLKVEVDKSREGGQGGKWGLRNKIVGGSGDKKFRPSLRMSVTGGRNKREEKMAKAFYSPTSDLNHGGYYSSMDETEGSISKAIRSDIKDIRSEKRDWKKQTSLTGADKRAGAKEFRKDIQTGRLSARYVRRGDLHSAGTKTWSEGENSRLKTWTADIDKKGNEGAMSGYVNAAEQDIQRISDLKQAETRNKTNAMIAGSRKNYTKQEEYIRSAEDNATNRNSTQARMNEFWGWNKKVQ